MTDNLAPTPSVPNPGDGTKVDKGIQPVLHPHQAIPPAPPAPSAPPSHRPAGTAADAGSHESGADHPERPRAGKGI